MLVHNRSNVVDFNFHLVLVTKYRKPIFSNTTYEKGIKAILQSIADNNEIVIQTMEVMPDHVHLLISFPPKMAPSSVVKSLKGSSGREWFKQFPETEALLWKKHLWTSSFFMSTVGNVSKNIVENYIKNQKQRPIGRPKKSCH